MDGSLPLVILCAADAITAFATALGPAFLAMEETNVVAGVSIVSAVLGMGGAYLLLPMLGTVGASIGRASAILLTGLLEFLVLKKTMRLKLDFLAITKTIAAGVVMVLAVVAVQMVGYSKFLFPIYAIIGVMVYLLMFRALKVVDSEDLRLLTNYLGKRFHWLSNILNFILLDPASRDSAQ